MIDLSNLENEVAVLESMRKNVDEKESQIIQGFLKIEKEVFEGKTYREYVNSLKIDEIKENVHVVVNGYSISAEIELEGVILSAYGSVWEEGTIRITAKYPNRELNNVPKKYAKEEKHLHDVCESYKIINPVLQLAKQHNINYN